MRSGTVAGLLMATVIGLLVGLFIGWVVWPVDWNAAEVDDLSPAAQAEYLSAVADAYVASGGEETGVALARLSALDDPEAALITAVRYYQQAPGTSGNIRQVNLRALAAAADIDETSLAAGQQATAPAFPQSAPLVFDEPEIGWLNWFLVSLTAIMLLAAGVYVGIQLVYKQAAANAEATSVASGDGNYQPTLWEALTARSFTSAPDKADEPDHQAEPSSSSPAPHLETQSTRNEDSGGSLQQWRLPADSSIQLEIDVDPETGYETDPDTGKESTWRIETDAAKTPHSPAPPPDEPTFAPEPENRTTDANHVDDGSSDETGTPSSETPDASSSRDPDQPEPGSDIEGGQSAAPGKSAREASDEVESAPAHAQVNGRASTGPDTDPGTPAEIGEDREGRDGDDDQENGFQPEGGTSTATATPGRQANAGRDVPRGDNQDAAPGVMDSVRHRVDSFLGRAESGQVGDIVREFTAEYQYGLVDDYDESFNIISPETDQLTGACGMGHNMDFSRPDAGQGPSFDSPEVRVLDVWFYEQATLRTHNQLLIARDVDVDRITERVQSSGTVTGEPLVAEPGLRFRLAGEQYLLECMVDDVEYLDGKGENPAFAHVKVTMTLRIRT